MHVGHVGHVASVPGRHLGRQGVSFQPREGSETPEITGQVSFSKVRGEQHLKPKHHLQTGKKNNPLHLFISWPIHFQHVHTFLN